MEKVSQHTFQQSFYEPRLFELAKESGRIYSASLNAFWKIYDEEGKWMSSYDLQAYMKDKISRECLHSDSYLGSLQLVHDNLASWKAAKKEYLYNPSRFSGEPNPPKKKPFLQKIIFKKSAIHVKDGFLLLSLAKGEEPIKVRWSLKKPKYVTINYSRYVGWVLNCTMETIYEQKELDKDKTIAVDLGVNRTATTFDGNITTAYNGKYIKSLNRLQNIHKAITQSKLSGVKKGSKREKKIKRAQRRLTKKFQNKKKDILHKYSKQIVDAAVQQKAGTIVFGDCSSIHDETNLGKSNNQMVQQNPEQALRKYVSQKFERIGGYTAVIPEPYTSQTCPPCRHRNRPKGRTFKCPECGFVFDRDGVGSINIFLEFKKVSFKQLNVVGLLTRPIGVKYRSCLPMASSACPR